MIIVPGVAAERLLGMVILKNKRVGYCIVGAFIFVGEMLGGGNDHAPVFTALIEAISVVVILWAGLFRSYAGLDRRALGLLLIVGFSILLVLAQMIPLPLALWSAMPGRIDLFNAFKIVGIAPGWHCLSLDPSATMNAALSLLPGIAAVVLGFSLSDIEVRRLLLAFVVIGILSCLLGTIQIVSSPDAPIYLYRLPPFQLPVGFYANRNHQALFLAACAVVTASFLKDSAARRGVRGGRFMFLALTVLFSLCALGTFSRAGSALLLLGLVLSLVTWRSVYAARFFDRKTVLVVLVVLGVGLALLNVYLLPQLAERLHGPEDPRFSFWPDVIYAVKQFFPFGSGFGTFDMIFRSVERLNAVSPTYVNHAHSDYLEVLLEGGIFGFTLIIMFLVWFFTCVLKSIKTRSIFTPTRSVSAIIILMILLHSILDYPLRNDSIMILGGLCCGFLARREKISPATDKFKLALKG